MATPCTLSVLTPLQCEILTRIAEGASRVDIAKERGTSNKTTEYHCMQIMQRLGIDNVADLTHWAIAMGLVKVKFKNETPEITPELLAKIHAAKIQAQRQAFAFRMGKDPNAPRVKKVLKNPAPIDPPVVVDPAGEDAWSEDIERSPIKELKAEPLKVEKLPEPVVINPKVETTPEPVNVKVEEVPAQEQSEVEPLPVVDDVPAQEQDPNVLVFKPVAESKPVVRKHQGPSYKSPVNRELKKLPFAQRCAALGVEPAGYMKGAINPDDNSFMSFNPHSVEFECTVPITKDPVPEMPVDVPKVVSTIITKQDMADFETKRVEKQKRFGVENDSADTVIPPCPKCGARHSSQYVCVFGSEKPKTVTKSVKMTPEALRLLAKAA